jgi:hypothetical protein
MFPPGPVLWQSDAGRDRQHQAEYAGTSSQSNHHADSFLEKRFYAAECITLAAAGRRGAFADRLLLATPGVQSKTGDSAA